MENHIAFDPEIRAELNPKSEMGALALQETVEGSGYLDNNFIQARKSFFVPHNRKRLFVGCSDDRGVTLESGEALASSYPQALDPRKAFASIYGGAAGLAKSLIVAGMTQYGPKFYQSIGRVDGAMDLLLRMNQGASILALHSADGTEESSSTFCMRGSHPTGCAYCGNFAAASNLLVQDTEVKEVARRDQKHIFGNDNLFDSIIESTGDFLAETGADYVIGRSQFASLAQSTSPAEIMILEGSHIDAKTSGLILNFDRELVGSANEAQRAGKGIYRTDVGIAAEVVLRSAKEYRIRPEIVVRAMIADSTPVRALLTQDTKAEIPNDARRLAIGVLGGREAVAKTLKELQLV